MPPEPTSSAGAVRAAARIHTALLAAKALDGLDSNLTSDILGSMAQIIDRETGACRSCEHQRKMGITLLDAKWLDPSCHKGCQSLAMKNQSAKLAEALEGMIRNFSVLSSTPTGVQRAQSAVREARSALAAWKEGQP